MIATLENPSSLMDRWRQRFGGRRRCNRRPRPLAALGYLTNGPMIEGLIEVEKLTLIILSDEPVRFGQHSLRLAGFSGSRVPWGIQWGGRENCRFLKNLSLQPVPNGPGLRLNSASTDLLRLGLQLDRDLERHVRRPSLSVRQRLRLPCLWAAFTPADAANITGDGPELAAYVRRTGKSPWRLMEQIHREYFGLSLLPFSWVSHHWQQAVAVFADLERFPRRQVFSLRRPADDLVGYQEAASFDFLRDRFRLSVKRHPRRQRKPVLVPA